MSVGVGFALEVEDQFAGMGASGGWGPPRTSTLFWAASGAAQSSNTPPHTNNIRSFFIGLSPLTLRPYPCLGRIRIAIPRRCLEGINPQRSRCTKRSALEPRLPSVPDRQERPANRQQASRHT